MTVPVTMPTIDWKPYPETEPELLTHDPDLGFEYTWPQSNWILAYVAGRGGYVPQGSRYHVLRFVVCEGWAHWESIYSFDGGFDNSLLEVTHWAPLTEPVS